MDNREAFSVREFCARYGICKQTFYDEIHRGRITAKKLGKKTVILRTDADAWAKSLPVLDPAGFLRRRLAP
jgi:excisionase family DNA binding protein